ncbi:hypothetical protein D3C81_1896670 [compost metagenome]
MLLRNFTHDREAQAAAFDIAAEDAIEAFKDALVFMRCDAGAGIFDLQECQSRFLIGAYAHRRMTAGRGVIERIVDQVVEQFAQHDRIAIDHDVVIRLLETEVDFFIE